VFGQMIIFAMGGQAEPFTKKTLNSFTVDELKQAYYTMNNTLILTRVVPYNETKGVDGGTLSIVNGEKVEIFEIPTGTIGKLMSANKGNIGISFSSIYLDRILFFSEELIGTEYFLVAHRSTVKYGKYDYKVNRKPKLLVQFTEQFIRDKTVEKETGWGKFNK
jgi:hypothetical protein